MPVSRLLKLRRLLFDLHGQGALAYCLLRDPRVPAGRKYLLMGALGLIASPVDLPAWMPVIGQSGTAPLALLALGTFIHACPPEVVEEHRRAVKAGSSIMHRDTVGLRWRAGAALSGIRGRLGWTPVRRLGSTGPAGLA